MVILCGFLLMLFLAGLSLLGARWAFKRAGRIFREPRRRTVLNWQDVGWYMRLSWVFSLGCLLLAIAAGFIVTILIDIVMYGAGAE